MRNFIFSENFVYLLNGRTAAMLTITISRQLKKSPQKSPPNFLFLQKQFYENHVTLNLGKCHCMLLLGHTQNYYISFNGAEIESSNSKFD